MLINGLHHMHRALAVRPCLQRLAVTSILACAPVVGSWELTVHACSVTGAFYVFILSPVHFAFDSFLGSLRRPESPAIVMTAVLHLVCGSTTRV
jgi:hypothetical protein